MPEYDVEAAAVEEVEVVRPVSGLLFQVARTLDEVVAAWRMVYMAYRRSGLIESNPYRIHTAPQAIGRHAAVITGCIGPITASTLTAFADSAKGLPLDRVYSDELARLRDSGKTLMEVGLFADRRKNLSRTADALFQLMRFAFYYGQGVGVTDYVIGVHPHHARFYIRAFGFQPLGEPKTYAAVNHRPVVLLHGDVVAAVQRRPLHPALDYFARNPVEDATFEGRFAFAPAEVAGSPIQGFLHDYLFKHIELKQSA